MHKFFQTCFTGIDNTTYDLGKVLWALLCLFGIGLVVASFITGKAFDLQQYGIGAAALLGAGSAAIRIKATTEPQP